MQVTSRNLRVFLSCVVVSVVVCNSAHAQTKYPMIRVTGVPVGAKTATYAQILAGPELTTTMPEVKIESFIFSLFPKGKDYIGPFTNKGGKLTAREIDILKRLQAAQTDSVKVFFEDIKATLPDKVTRSMAPLIFTIIN